MGLLTYTKTLVAGTPENVADVQTMFDQLRTLVNGQLDSANILDGSILGADILDGTISGADVLDASIGGVDLADNNIGLSKLNFSPLYLNGVGSGGRKLTWGYNGANSVVGSELRGSVAHGLGATPGVAFVIGVDTWHGGYVSWVNVDATNLSWGMNRPGGFSAGNLVNCYWLAIV